MSTGTTNELIAIIRDIATVKGASAAARREDRKDPDSMANIIISDYTNAVRTRVVEHLKYDRLSDYAQMTTLAEQAWTALQAGDRSAHAYALETLDVLVTATLTGKASE